MDDANDDTCRVCQLEGTSDQQLFHPCICTGSIKYIHQECLVRWLQTSGKEFCEICKHKFKFRPIYRPGTPAIMPLSELLEGLLHAVLSALRCWLHYAIVAVMWLVVVPLTCCRIYKFFFSPLDWSFYKLCVNFVLVKDVQWDCITGVLIVALGLVMFIGIVYLRDQIVSLEPDWLTIPQPEQPHQRQQHDVPVAPHFQPAAGALPQHHQQEAGGDNGVNQGLNPNNHLHVPVGGGGGAPGGANEQNAANGGWQPWVPGPNLDVDPLGWERLLGLDLTWQFLEHVVWVITINVMSILIFAYVPYTAGMWFLQLVSNVLTLVRGYGLETMGSLPFLASAASRRYVATDAYGLPRDVRTMPWLRMDPSDSANVLSSFTNLLDIFYDRRQPRCFDFTTTTLSTDERFDRFSFMVARTSGLGYNGALSSDGEVAESLPAQSRLVTGFVILVGYCAATAVFLFLHSLCKTIAVAKRYGPESFYGRLASFAGKCYLISKVLLLLVVELGFFPIFCGAALDLFSIPLLGTTMQSQLAAMRAFPFTLAFLHWVAGMLTVFYFSSLIILLRELLRPGVLWFLRNIADPDFNPIHELILIGVPRQLCRWVLSSLLMLVVLANTVYLPALFVQRFFTGFLPYRLVFVSLRSGVSQSLLDLTLLQCILPALLEYGHLRQWISRCLTVWLRVVGRLLGIQSYLLPSRRRDQQRAARRQRRAGAQPLPHGDEDDVVEPPPGQQFGQENIGEAENIGGGGAAGDEQQANLGVWHQQMLHVRTKENFQAYARPRYFPARIAALCMATLLTAFIVSTLFLTVPAAVGRAIFKLNIFDHLSKEQDEVFTVFVGLVVIWAAILLALKAEQLIRAAWRPAKAFYAAFARRLAEERVPRTTQRLNVAPAVVEEKPAPIPPVATRTTALSARLRNGSAFVGYVAWWRGHARALARGGMDVLGLVVTGVKRLVPFVFSMVFLLLIIPFLLGSCFFNYFYVFAKVGVLQLLTTTPLHDPAQQWLIGLLLTKIVVAVALGLPGENPIKDEIQRLFEADGVWQHNFVHCFVALYWPVVFTFGLSLAVPYIVQHSYLPALVPLLVGDDPRTLAAWQAMVCLVLDAIAITVWLMCSHTLRLAKLYTHIKNKKYMVGRQLINYYPTQTTSGGSNRQQ